jgi:large subunit ribosomal protein L13
MSSENSIIIDAKGLILGRMSSSVAKCLLQGESIVIVNAEQAAISGKRLQIVKEAKTFLEVGHPRKGPNHPRRPDMIVRKTIRGMIPYRKAKGRDAMKRLRVYLGAPKEFEGKETKTVGDLAKEIGWSPEVE